jgi:2-polyprenyl-3-methyl-5-hydroxy-6-metoxy-1,4-benzoquinol methylase
MTAMNCVGKIINDCPLCGYGQTHSRPTGLLMCKKCGLVFAPGIWEPRANEAMEDEWFGESWQPDASFWVRWFESWNDRRTLRRLDKYKSRGNSLLEVGVGSGSLLRTAQRLGFTVMGSDLSKPITMRVERDIGIAMHCGHLSELTDARQYDVIVTNHILEHVSDPVGFLREVLRLLKPDGIVHIVVPNVACWEAKFPGWVSYQPYHLIYFNPDTLTRCVMQSGLQVEEVTTYESFSGWFLAVLRTLLRLSQESAAPAYVSAKREGAADPPRRHPIAEHAYRLSMVVVGLCIWPLRKLQGHLHRGDEVVLIARKTADAR